MRTYYTWQLSASPDKSYLMAACGLWTDAELSVGIIVGCFPVMPKFFQHVGPKVFEAFPFLSKSVCSCGQELKSRSRILDADTHTQIRKPFAKYMAGPSIAESCDDPYTRLHGEYYTLNESEVSQRQATAAVDLTREAGAGPATRREDLEYGHQRS